MDGPRKKSTKPSATNSKPPDDVTFFIDASLGRKVVAQALRDDGARVETHDDHFAQGTTDEKWLAAVGAEGWVVLTKDDRIRYRDLERRALVSAGVRAFVLKAKNLRGVENADIFVSSLPAIYGFLNRHNGPFIATITRSGTISLVVNA